MRAKLWWLDDCVRAPVGYSQAAVVTYYQKWSKEGTAVGIQGSLMHKRALHRKGRIAWFKPTDCSSDWGPIECKKGDQHNTQQVVIMLCLVCVYSWQIHLKIFYDAGYLVNLKMLVCFEYFFCTLFKTNIPYIIFCFPVRKKTNKKVELIQWFRTNVGRNFKSIA